MAAASLRHEERIGLAIAVAAHVALVAWLVLGPPLPAPLPPVERTEVTLTDDAALTSTAPEPAAAPAPQVAPELGSVEPEVAPLPLPRLAPIPLRPVVAAPSVQPTLTPRPAPAAARPATPPRGSLVGKDFLKGFKTPAPGTAKSPPAAAIGPAVRSSLAGAVLRQIRPNWQGRVPQGVGTERIVTILSIELNPDGSLARRPTFIGQEGIDDSNRAQARRHIEEAIKAVQLSAPFRLPPELYEAWKRLPPLRFRKST